MSIGNSFAIPFDFSLSQKKYYISNAGNDLNDGLSPATSWQTITKVNTFVFDAGDIILFKSGDIWIVADAAGTDCLNITNNNTFYNSYGLGAKPIITGKQSLLGWDNAANWTNTAGNIWRYSNCLMNNLYQFNNRGRLWIDNVEVQKINNINAPSAALPWTHNLTDLYVYSVGNPAGTFINIETVGVYPACLTCIANDIEIKNLDIRGGGNVVQFAGNNITFDSCNIGFDSGQCGIMNSWGSTDADNLVIKNCTFDTNDTFNDLFSFNNTEEGILLNYGTNVEIFGNTFKNWSHSCFGIVQGNILIPLTNVKFHNNNISCPDTDYGRGIGLAWGDAAHIGECTGMEFYNNYIYNTPTQNQIQADGAIFYNNIIDTVRGDTYTLGYVANGLMIGAYTGQPQNNHIYNNVIMNCKESGIIFPYTGAMVFSNNIIENNILFNNLQYALDIRFSPGCWLESTFKNNLLYNAADVNVVFLEKMAAPIDKYMTAARFNLQNGSTVGMIAGEVADIEEDNVSANPLFNGLTDYHLTVGSIAIDSGIAIVGYIRDFENIAIVNPPNIGVYETVL